MRLRFAVLAIPAVLAGCATWGPTWSEVTGRRFNLAVADRRAVEIVSVGEAGGWVNSDPLKVVPGRQRVVVASFPHAGFLGGRQQEFELDIKPCMRYYVNAQFESSISPRFEIVVDQVETIAGCAAAKG
ncbi:MAG: hypothetical protein U1F64_11455 [Burkholderiales bacterium]|mgnify:CR=1 FL=1